MQPSLDWTANAELLHQLQQVRTGPILVFALSCVQSLICMKASAIKTHHSC